MNNNNETKKKKVLVIDDDKAYSGILELKLTNAGYDVKIVFDGEGGITEVENFNPDIILLDVIMPGKDGFEVLKTLKDKTKTSSIPVFVFSNLSNAKDIERLEVLGAKKYLVKSEVSINEIVDLINGEVGQ